MIGGLSSRALVIVGDQNGKAAETERLEMRRRIRDVIEAPDGAILLATDGGNAELLRLTPAGGAGR